MVNKPYLQIVKSGLEKGDQHVTQNAIDVVDELVKQKTFESFSLLTNTMPYTGLRICTR